jgi:hypothetical protein
MERPRQCDPAVANVDADELRQSPDDVSGSNFATERSDRNSCPVFDDRIRKWNPGNDAICPSHHGGGIVINIRPMVNEDLDPMELASNADKVHPGLWTREHFTGANKMTEVIEDSQGPLSYVLFTKTLRISCVWESYDSPSRNAKAVIYGLQDAIIKAKQSGFTEIAIESEHWPLRLLLRKLGFVSKGRDLVLSLET